MGQEPKGSSNEIVGRKVWVTRDAAWSNFEVWERKPERRDSGWFGKLFVTGGFVTSVCEGHFHKWLGTKPTDKLAEGGPDAIEAATLYVGIDWGHE